MEASRLNAAIIVAAGKGTRMGPNVDKLFLELNGKPVIAHTWDRFDRADCIAAIVLVVREGLQDVFHELAATYKLKKSYTLVVGGRERQDSVWNGLMALPTATKIVAIQDGARPCTSASLIQATITAAESVGASVAAQAVTDTIKESADGKTIARNLERSKLWSVQTPQTFRVEVIRRALNEVRTRGLLVTDDTAACELIHQPVQLVIDPAPNPKITRPEDIPHVAAVLNSRQ